MASRRTESRRTSPKPLRYNGRMTSADIRRSFLTFFERHEHRVVASSSLVPADDPTLLFINAGMNQFKDVFLGRESRPYRRATTAQKCMRVSGKHNDLDNVGPSLRHHTFFEMLGNFSFGDYFKEEAIHLAWTLLTEEWRLDPTRLHPTVFGGEAGIPRDDEAHRTWTTLVPADRIVELGIDENFWSMGDTGPSGRCSEVHYFRGEHLPCDEPTCQGISCRCDRFVEIWNNVFMEFDRQTDGRLEPLPAPSIDTGMGLERIAAIMQDTVSNYETDVFQPILRAIGERTGHAYGASPEADVSMRVIADHLRATTFLIADGVVPSNEWRGYVLRKIMRRAMRHGMRLGLGEPFLHGLVDVVVTEMGVAYPDLGRQRDSVVAVVQGEEERFEAVLTTGLARLEDVLDRASAGDGVVQGAEIFKLYDSLGLPVDFIEDLAGERGLEVDRQGFERAMDAQRERARSSSTFATRAAQDFTFAADDTAERVRTLDDRFEGYDATRLDDVRVIAVFDDDRQEIGSLHEGQAGYVVLERTPFYLEAGGQVSDVGRLCSDDVPGLVASVDASTRVSVGGPRAHHVHVSHGLVRPDDVVQAAVTDETRDATRRNHTATHLLHASLRSTLGTHVTQAGSLVAPDRLRFDFVHGAPLTREEVDAIEGTVNDQILRNVSVETEVRSPEQAIADGAMALFGEKYGDLVRVVSVPGFSVELCGGTHCRATGDIGSFTIVHEGGVAAGVRRIEAITGSDAVDRARRVRRLLADLTDALGVPEAQAREAVAKLQRESKQLGREVTRLKMQVAIGDQSEGAETIEQLGEVTLLTRRADGLDKAELRELADRLQARLSGPGVVVLAAASDGRVAIVASVSKALIPRVHAGKIVKTLAPIVGGGGGGRPDFAEAGGKDPDQIHQLLTASRTVVSDMLG